MNYNTTPTHGSIAVTGVLERREAGVHKTRRLAAIEALDALLDIPYHYVINNLSIWQYAETVVSKGGKWTWSFDITTEVGAHSRATSDAAERADRLMLLLDAYEAASVSS